MPAARNRGVVAPSAPVPSTSVSSRVRKLPARGKRVIKPKEPKEAPVCSICYDDLASKRDAKTSCSHLFHRTCIINWLETRKNTGLHLCPNCRTPVTCIRFGRKQMKYIEAFGKLQQPTLWWVHRRLERGVINPQGREVQREQTTKLALDYALMKTQEELKFVRAQRTEAQKKGEKPEFITDIKEEMDKLAKRIKIFEQMQTLRDEAMGLLPTSVARIQWNLQYELRRLKNTTLDPVPASADSTDADSDDYYTTASEEDSDDYIVGPAISIRRIIGADGAMINYDSSDSEDSIFLADDTPPVDAARANQDDPDLNVAHLAQWGIPLPWGALRPASPIPVYDVSSDDDDEVASIAARTNQGHPDLNVPHLATGRIPGSPAPLSPIFPLPVRSDEEFEVASTYNSGDELSAADTALLRAALEVEARDKGEDAIDFATALAAFRKDERKWAAELEGPSTSTAPW